MDIQFENAKFNKLSRPGRKKDKENQDEIVNQTSIDSFMTISQLYQFNAQLNSYRRLILNLPPIDLNKDIVAILSKTKKNTTILNRFAFIQTTNLTVNTQSLSKSNSNKRARENSPIPWNPLSQPAPKKRGRRPKVGSALEFQ